MTGNLARYPRPSPGFVDRESSKIAAKDSLILLQVEIVKDQVETRSIIKHFDVRGKIRSCLVSGIDEAEIGLSSL